MADANTMSLTEACVTKLAKDAAQLSKLYADYSRPRDFKPGDFVNFHPSMRNRPNPGEHVLGIVTRVLSCPFYEDFE